MQITDAIDSIEDVKEDPWQGPQGPIWFVQGKLASGAQYSVGSKSLEVAHEKHEALSALIGESGQFEVEQKGEYRGKPKYSLKAWPGKPAFGSQQKSLPLSESQAPSSPPPSRGGYQVRYRDTPEGFAQEQRSIHRSVALEHAVAFIGSGVDKHQIVLENAEAFFQWLHQDAPAQSLNAPTNESPGAGNMHGLTTGDRILSPFESAAEAIRTAIQAKDQTELEAIRGRIVASVDKNRIGLDDAEKLDTLLTEGKKIIASAVLHAAWVKEKQIESKAREPIGHGEKLLQEARDRF